MSRTEQVRQLVKGIQLDVKQYQQLKSLIRHQHSLLERRDSDALAQHNPRQDELCQTLEQRARQRTELLSSLGLSSDSKGMQRLLSAIPGDKGRKIGLLWRQLQQLVRQCKEQNDINGRLLNSQQRCLSRLVTPEKVTAFENDYGQLQP
ncbi:flagellar protein FlgN [Ferrimonas sediminicola]|uniref:Flagellar protein FlgN n=1 Tax=Ferrimonas sediminicola TaxID=2569538 RepID=A0A4V5NV23_9GAMM|nr:flagellar protein FlgN [Ferrimonas sediminicola]TKB47788.1 flagellar protein FlgN [Ferrimonas sediminicola]